MSQPATPSGSINPSTPVAGTTGGHHQNSATLGGTGGGSAPVAPGVQVLLDAEKEANRIVQQAHRVQRLKDARNEAQAEIEALKSEKVEEYTAYERAVMGSLEGAVAEYAKETAIRLEEVQRTGEAQLPVVVSRLLEAITKVEPRMHVDARLRLEK